MRILRTSILIIISVTLTAYSGGLSLSKHWCAGEVVSKSINMLNEECSDMETPMQEPGINKPSCCANEYAFFQSDHFQKDQSLEFHPADLISDSYGNLIVQVPFVQPKSIPFYAEPPPDLPVYIKVQRFLI